MQAVEEILHYLPISETIGTAGQPTEDQFAAIRAAGYELVINLALASSPQALPNEPERAVALGMEHVHIPVVWESPDLESLQRFFDVMDAHRGRKVLAHCVVNMRVSCFVFLYRVVRLGVAVAEARETMLKIWEPNPTWQRFIDDALAHYGIETG